MNLSFPLRLCSILLGVWIAGRPGLAQPAAPDPAAPPPAAPAAAPAPAVPEADDRANLRRIDGPPADVAASESRGPSRRVRRDGNDFPVGNHVVPQGTRMREIVSLFGSSVVEGEVTSDAVSILGRTEIARGAKVGGAAVAVLGRLESDGEIGQDSVSVLGASAIDGRVGGDVVTVLGNLHLGPNAVIERDLVVVGGRLTKDPGAVVRGEQVHISFLPGRGDVEWLATWFERCALLGRPLAFGAHLGWAWVVAGAFLGFHLFVALLFPRVIAAGAQTLETRPGGSVLASLLTVILTPVAFVLLAITLIGALVVPLLGLGLMLAALVGKTVMLAWLGRRFTGLSGSGSYGPPVLAVLIGGVIVAGLYTIPVVGFLTFKLLSWLGLGVVVYTIALAMKRERPALAVPMAPSTPPPPAPVPPAPPISPVPRAGSLAGDIPAAAGAPLAAVASPAGTPAAVGFTVMTPVVPPVVPVSEAAAEPVAPPASAAGIPSMPSATAPSVAAAIAWPRAGFFIRMAALALDGVLIGLILNLVSSMTPRFLQFNNGPGGLLLLLAVYGACMWKLRGTTIGGIVCGLKVVRIDQRELDWPTSVVRALGCFLSLAVGGLGFIWVAFDDEKQSWHDKIAGTTVVRVPKGVSLV